MLSKAISQKPLAKSKKSILLLIAYCLMPIASNAQCAMCRAALESEGNTVKAEAVNDGIMYLMAIPYILVGIAGFFVYRMFSKKKG
jgi:hypothetical protein